VLDEHERERLAIGIRRSVFVLLKQRVHPLEQFASARGVELETEPDDLDAFRRQALDFLQEGLNESLRDVVVAGVPAATRCKVRNFACPTWPASRLFRNQEPGVYEGSDVVEQCSRVHSELVGKLLVRAGLVQAQPQDAHPERRRECTTATGLLGFVGVIPRAHDDTIRLRVRAIDFSQWDAMMKT
jgi:hypothetical protein